MYLMEARGIYKTFDRVSALRGIDFVVGFGEVVALLGDNGAGKSTLIKILTGVHRPSAGELLWNGSPVRFSSPAGAMKLGISVVYQDLAIVNSMSIYRNIFLGRERLVSMKVGPVHVLEVQRARREAASLLDDLGVHIKSIDAPVKTLSGGERQSIAIARAIHFESKLLIMDEPTSALSVKESAKVLKYIEQAKQKNISVIVITHNIGSVYAIADRVVVLALGRTIAHASRTDPSGAFPTPGDLAELIVGEKLKGGGA